MSSTGLSSCNAREVYLISEFVINQFFETAFKPGESFNYSKQVWAGTSDSGTADLVTTCRSVKASLRDNGLVCITLDVDNGNLSWPTGEGFAISNTTLPLQGRFQVVKDSNHAVSKQTRYDLQLGSALEGESVFNLVKEHPKNLVHQPDGSNRSEDFPESSIKELWREDMIHGIWSKIVEMMRTHLMSNNTSLLSMAFTSTSDGNVKTVLHTQHDTKDIHDQSLSGTHSSQLVIASLIDEKTPLGTLPALAGTPGGTFWASSRCWTENKTYPEHPWANEAALANIVQKLESYDDINKDIRWSKILGDNDEYAQWVKGNNDPRSRGTNPAWSDSGYKSSSEWRGKQWYGDEDNELIIRRRSLEASVIEKKWRTLPLEGHALIGHREFAVYVMKPNTWQPDTLKDPPNIDDNNPDVNLSWHFKGGFFIEAIAIPFVVEDSNVHFGYTVVEKSKHDKRYGLAKLRQYLHRDALYNTAGPMWDHLWTHEDAFRAYLAGPDGTTEESERCRKLDEIAEKFGHKAFEQWCSTMPPKELVYSAAVKNRYIPTNVQLAHTDLYAELGTMQN